MNRKLFSLAVAVVGFAAGPAANAATLTFESPDTFAFQYLASPYAGLNFTNFAVVDRNGYGPSGYANVVVSGDQSACGCASDFGQTISSITSASAFDFLSGYFASAWNDGATLTINGFLGASLVYSGDFVLNTSGPQFLNLGFTGIDRAEFSILGGTPSGLPGGGNYFAADDLVINTAGVPEPASWALMIAGFGLTGAAMRRRQSVRVTYA